MKRRSGDFSDYWRMRRAKSESLLKGMPVFVYPPLHRPVVLPDIPGVVSMCYKHKPRVRLFL